MRELDDAALELQLRHVLSDRLGSLELGLTPDALERRRQLRDKDRRRRRNVIVLGLAAALVVPAGWLAAGAPAPNVPDPRVTVVTPTPSPSVVSEPKRPIVEELGPFGTGQVSSFGSVRLADGRVLLVGGVDTSVGQQTIAAAWVFDPATERIVPTGAMTEPRTDPLAITLTDGRVLVIGGSREDPSSGAQDALSTAELYDPATGAFTPTTALPDARRDCPCGALNRLPWALQRATLLRDGRVFLAGGQVEGGLGTGSTNADVFDPETGAWDQLDIGCDAARGTQVLMADGRLLIVCVDGSAGSGAPIDLRARLFDPGTDTFADAAVPTAMDSVATALADGRILLTGRDPKLYDPALDAYLALPAGPRPAAGQPGIGIDRGRALFPGYPADGQPTLLFDPRSETFTVVPQPEFGMADAVVPLLDGRILSVGYRLDARLLDPEQLP